MRIWPRPSEIAANEARRPKECQHFCSHNIWAAVGTEIKIGGDVERKGPVAMVMEESTVGE